MREWVRLIAPIGTDEANDGTTRYHVHDDGTIVVPFDVAEHLTHGAAGFVVAPADTQPGDDYVPPPERR